MLISSSNNQNYLPPIVQQELGEGRVLLKNGSTALLRTASEEDLTKVVELLQSVSDETRYRRFFSGIGAGEKLARRLLYVGDASDRLTLLVLQGELDDLEIMGMGSYVTLEDNSRTAEPAFLVHDDYQGLGIGTLLLERLALMAVKNGITQFEAHTLPDNQQMKEVFEQSGFEVETAIDHGTFTISFPISPSQEMVERYEFRDLMATIASLKSFFEPEGVAVIGASRDSDSPGNRILSALVDASFTGNIYPVNPKTDTLMDLYCHDRVTGIEETVDLAVISVPRESISTVLDDCYEKDINALLTITGGLSETHQSDPNYEDELINKIFGYGMRMIGPNCFGLLNTDQDIRLNASFSPTFPKNGNVAIASQSGALGLAILDIASNRDIGLSYFVSIGNKLDVSGNDLIQYWSEDNRTEVILLYLETFGNPRRFARLAKKISLKKPIVVVEKKRNAFGQETVGSHTDALITPDVTMDNLFKQAGIIGADSLEESLDLTSFLSSQPLPAGPGVAVITNSGGSASFELNTCENIGLNAVEFSDSTCDQLRQVLADAGKISNPIDIASAAGPEEYRQVIETLHHDPVIDSIIVIYSQLELDADQEIIESIRNGIVRGRESADRTIPVAGVLSQPENHSTQLTIDDEAIPTYRFPETAAKVIDRAYRYKNWKHETEDSAPTRPKFSDVDTEQARNICQSGAGVNDSWLGLSKTVDVLEAVGINTPENRLITSREEALAEADSIGYPVVLKMFSETLVQKSNWDGVRLNLSTKEDVGDAYQDIRNNLQEGGKLDELDGMVVQPHIDDGLEVMVGMTEDDVFGPLITFGLGGTYIEILEDVSVRITPLTYYDANQMLDEIKGNQLLDGYRGAPPADREALLELLLKLSVLAEDVPEITEMVLNPVKAFQPGEGYIVLDARIYVSTNV